MLRNFELIGAISCATAKYLNKYALIVISFLVHQIPDVDLTKGVSDGLILPPVQSGL